MSDLLFSIVQKTAQKYGLETPAEPFWAEWHKPLRLGRVLDQIKKQSCDAGEAILHFHSYRLDCENHLFIKGDQRIVLTEKESALLALLVRHAGESVGRSVILHHVWNYAQEVETHTLETHIYRLRQKVEEDPSHPRLILTSEDGYMVLAGG